ncbi:hypothetical protein [Eisenbergiella sp.]
MTRKNKSFLKILLLFSAAVLFLLIFSLALSVRKKNGRFDVPVFSGRLHWGDGEEEILHLLDSPPTEEIREDSTKILYAAGSFDTPFGECSSIQFYISTTKLADDKPLGLYAAALTLSHINGKSVQDAVVRHYGELAEVSWDGGNSSPAMSFYYPEAARFSSLFDGQWGKIVSYYEMGQKQNDPPEHRLQYQLEKMHDNDYYVMIRFREPDYIFINALHLAVLERME